MTTVFFQQPGRKNAILERCLKQVSARPDAQFFTIMLGMPSGPTEVVGFNRFNTLLTDNGENCTVDKCALVTSTRLANSGVMPLSAQNTLEKSR